MTADISLSFDIEQWYAVSNRLCDEQQWHDWAHGILAPDDLPEYKPDVAFLPAMQRRRMALLARLMFAAAWPLLAEQEHCPLLLISHDGEINRGFELWYTLFAEGDVSPTSFGLSVHNALAGQWSMLRGDMSEHSALAIHDAALEYALLDGMGLLNDGAEKVLLVFADEPLAEKYSVRDVARPPFAHALAMIMRRGSQFHLSRTLRAAPEDIDDAVVMQDCWGALSFVRQQYLRATHWHHYYRGETWYWEQAPCL